MKSPGNDCTRSSPPCNTANVPVDPLRWPGGAVGLLGEDGSLHRVSGTPAPDEISKPVAEVEPETQAETETIASEPDHSNEPLLSADELRALLQEQPDGSPEVQ